jgi:hypothetical protein
MRIFKFLSHKLTFVLIFLISIGLFISSCKKEGKHYYISEEFNSWCFFNRGSYWIYRNDSTLLLDSVYLTKDPVIVNVPRDDSKNATTCQEIQISLKSGFNNSCVTQVGIDGTEIFGMTMYNNVSAIGLVAQPLQYFVPYYSLSGDEVSYQTLSYDSVFVIGQNQFLNVVKTKNIIHGSSNNYNFFFAKHIGLIKVVFETPDSIVSWSLLRYHAIQ